MRRQLQIIAAALLGGWIATGSALAQTPIIDMTADERYEGLRGDLYPGATNDPPATHDAEGRARAAAIRAIDGRIVFMAIGLSNSHQEWCGKNTAAKLPCNDWTFMGQAAADPTVDHQTLAIVNGALAGQETETWDDLTDANYPRIEVSWLTPLGLTPSQVQVVQMLEMTGPVFDGTTADPATPSLPDASSDAFFLVSEYGRIARTLKAKYPNLEMIFVSPRAFGGFGTSADGNANPEPYAYETGFAAKLFIGAQIQQCAVAGCAGPVDPLAGDLNYANGTAPWITWGAYLWANGTTANSEGLFYLPGDFQASGQHPTQAGETVIASKLLDFYRTSPYATPWFTAAGEQACTADHTCLRSADIATRARGREVVEATARVTVENDLGAAVPDAEVFATWTLPDGSRQSATGTTSARGVATLTVSGPPGPYTIRITNITKAGSSFDGANSIVTATFTR